MYMKFSLDFIDSKLREACDGKCGLQNGKSERKKEKGDTMPLVSTYELVIYIRDTICTNNSRTT